MMLAGLGVMAVALAAHAAAFEAEDVTAATDAIQSACGTSPAIVVSWDDFDKDEDARAGFLEGGLAFLSGALAEACKDESLKAEVARQIEKIVITQAYGAADPVIYLVNGTLHIEYLWVKGEPAPDATFVRTEITSRLRGEEAEAP